MDGALGAHHMGKLIEEVIRDPRIPLQEEGAEVPEEGGLCRSNLCAFITGDAWGDANMTTKNKRVKFVKIG